MKRTAPARRNRGCRRGTAAVEFAVVLPLLVLICTVAVDCGRFAFGQIALVNAVRVGAEWGATNSLSPLTQTWQTQIKAAVAAEMADVSNFNASQFTVTIATTTDSYDLNRVTITANYEFQPLLAWPGMSGAVPMGCTLCVRQFR